MGFSYFLWSIFNILIIISIPLLIFYLIKFLKQKSDFYKNNKSFDEHTKKLDEIISLLNQMIENE